MAGVRLDRSLMRICWPQFKQVLEPKWLLRGVEKEAQTQSGLGKIKFDASRLGKIRRWVDDEIELEPTPICG